MKIHLSIRTLGLSFLLGASALGTTNLHAAPKTTKATSAAMPANLVGKWAMTSISGTTYWDKSTGAYKGSGYGGSQTYVFEPNGRYKLFSYLKTNTYGWEMQALTWEDGTATVSNGKITLRPTSGKYQMMDNRVSKNNTTRPMKPEERKVKTLPFSVSGKVLKLNSVDFKKQP